MGSIIKATHVVSGHVHYLLLEPGTLIVAGSVKVEDTGEVHDCTVIYTKNPHPQAQVIYAKEKPEELLAQAGFIA